MQLGFHPWDPFLTNNHNMMIDNSVEKNCFLVFNVKLQVKFRFKTFYGLLKLLSCQTQLITACFAQTSILYEPELNI